LTLPPARLISAGMIDDIKFLDDATRPPPVKLEGLTEAQRAGGAHLKEIHDHLRDNMRVLGTLIERARSGKASVAEVTAEASGLAMVANLRRFGNLCGQYCAMVNVHHSIEDQALFPAIAAQGPAFKAIADRLVAEHVVVHELLERLVAALGDLAREPDDSHFEDAVTIYRALEKVLLSHLGYEEDAIGDALGYFDIL